MNVVIKVGGAFLNRSNNTQWMDEVIELRGQGHNIYIVHGAGPYINKAYEDNNVVPKFVDGQRVTSPEEIPMVENVLSKQVNPQLVNKFILKGAKAIGISGADKNLLSCHPLNPKLGQVGEVSDVNIALLKELADQGIVVISPIGEGEGKKFNVNADVAAAAIARALPECTMAFLTGTEGLLDAKGKLISKINTADVEDLIKTKVIQGGMIVKINMIKTILETSERVGIINATKKESLLNFVKDQSCSGTIFIRS